jgi:DNA replication protein DnaC
MTTRIPQPPPLPPELEALLRRMRLPHIRRLAPEVLATARAQRWEPAEVLRVLLAEEVAGRERSSIATRRAGAGFPTGKTFDAWDPELSSVPLPTQAALRTLEWVGRRENLVVCGPSGTGKTMFLEAARPPSKPAGASPGSASSPSACSCAATEPTTPSPEQWPASSKPIWWSWTTSGSYRSPKASTASSTPYEKRSVAVSSNLHPSGFDEIMPKTLATATVDRLLHHAHLCVTEGTQS